jgi:NADH dehydrogenase [ubiquinone] 1 alpha subcomplex assembly factor 2
MEDAPSAMEEEVLDWYARIRSCELEADYAPGQDLTGNTYWEFKDALNHGRLRRIVRFPGRSYHSDVQVSPLWHQWLRYTRHEPPSLQEQSADLMRQSELKHNAMLADARWAAKAKYIESPKPRPEATPPSQQPTKQTSDAKEDPWAKANETAKNPGSEWKPEAWVPGSAKR